MLDLSKHRALIAILARHLQCRYSQDRLFLKNSKNVLLCRIMTTDKKSSRLDNFR